VYDHVDKVNKQDQDRQEDEVEDLLELLSKVKEEYPTVEGVSTGAILSTYQRTRIESVCGRLGLTPLSYLWRMGPQRCLLECMLKDGIEAVLVKVASPPGLVPRKHLNKTLGDLYYGGIFDKLKEKFDFHICGEGGEYETLVLDCPIFKKKLVLSNVEIIEGDDGVGVLKVHECHAVDKHEEDGSCISWDVTGPLLYERINEDAAQSHDIPTDSDIMEEAQDSLQSIPEINVLPHVKVLPGGLAHVSEILSPFVPCSEMYYCSSTSDNVEAEMAVMEAKSIFSILEATLKTIQWTAVENHVRHSAAATPKDVVFVHLYLSDISHFKDINAHYSAFFGTVLPPSRSCVAVGKNVLPGGRRVMMDCLIQRGSGEYMRISPDFNSADAKDKLSAVNAAFVMDHIRNPHHQLRSTLHVQSISHWAPVCVGPYSQANTLRSGIIFMAGQIGLRPETMKLISHDWKVQLRQSWRNASSVLDALQGSLKDALAAVVYIASKEVIAPNNSFRPKLWKVCENICRECLLSNGNIESGIIDGMKVTQKDELYGGYEDYETYREIMASQNIDVELLDNECEVNNRPLLMVSLPQMPVGAVSEVELICATQKASSCLSINVVAPSDKQPNYADKSYDNPTAKGFRSASEINWDTGYDGIIYDEQQNIINDTAVRNTPVKIHSIFSHLSKGCAAIGFATASYCTSSEKKAIRLESIFEQMIDSAVSILQESAGLGISNILHIRLFYVCNPAYDNSLALKSSLQASLSILWNAKLGNRTKQQLPATSIVPVQSMAVSPSFSSSSPFVAMQFMVADLLHMETEMWIHHNRAT
jgi:Predicted ATPases of PP-loop superfamily